MKNCLLLIFTAIAFNLNAQTQLADIFGDKMVLQRNTEVNIWGVDNPNTTVIVTTDWGETANTKADKTGKWSLKIKTIDAGKPHSIKVEGTTKVVLKDVLLGEVWIASGQSNMEMPLRGFKGQPVYGSNDAILNSNNPNLRFYQVKRKISGIPLKTNEGEWQISTPFTTPSLSAVAYSYGKMLQETIGVPVGIITTSWGGTPAEAWTPRSVIESQFSELETAMNDKKSFYQKSPTALYNGMIHPLIPFTIKGVIWYQGEANRKNPAQYTTLFPAMISSWRTLWKQGDFPFYYVQIAPFSWGKNNELLRESQLKVMETLPNIGMAVTMDIGESTCIHPAQKLVVGKRLAYWSLAKDYGFETVQYSGPIYKSMTVKDDKVTLDFDYAPLGVCTMGKELNGFVIAGTDRKFYPAKTEIKKGKLTVWNEEVANPVAVRYGWQPFIIGTLFNTAGLPASSFRTDDW